MKDKLIKLQEILANTKEFNQDSVNKLVSETLKVFAEIMSKLQSTNEEEKKEAIAVATELRQILETSAQEALKSLGMSPEQIGQFVNEQSNFSDAEWSALQMANESVNSYKKELSDQGLISTEEKAPKKKSTQKKAWIAG